MHQACHETMVGSLLGLLCVSLASSAVAFGAPSNSLPAFIWGSGDYISHSASEKGVQAIHKAIPDSYLIDSVLGYLCSAQQDASVVPELSAVKLSEVWEGLASVFIVGDLRRSDLAQAGAHTNLKERVEAAPSALYLSNVQSEVANLSEAVTLKADSLLQVGDCGGRFTDPEALQKLLANQQGRQAVLVCDTQGQGVFDSVFRQLEDSKRPYLAVYVGQPEKDLNSRPSTRSLISTSVGADQSKYLCTGKCMVQVRLFEALILLILLLSALGTGLCMLHILDTPSRFEVEKKDISRHQD